MLDRTQPLGHGEAMNSSQFIDQLNAKFGHPERFNDVDVLGSGHAGLRWSDSITVVKLYDSTSRRRSLAKRISITVSGTRVFAEEQSPKNFARAARSLLLDRPVQFVS